ncbi:MAG: hypothetical protein AB1405_04715 [Bdellovibrionota bacterium]
MAQIPQITQISGKLAKVVGESLLPDNFGQRWNSPKKTMITLIRLIAFPVIQKYLAPLALLKATPVAGQIRTALDKFQKKA